MPSTATHTHIVASPYALRTWSVAFALTPFLGLQVRNAYGDATMWVCVAVLGIVAGILGIVAARGHDHEAAVASPA